MEFKQLIINSHQDLVKVEKLFGEIDPNNLDVDVSLYDDIETHLNNVQKVFAAANTNEDGEIIDCLVDDFENAIKKLKTSFSYLGEIQDDVAEKREAFSFLEAKELVDETDIQEEDDLLGHIKNIIQAYHKAYGELDNLLRSKYEFRVEHMRCNDIYKEVWKVYHRLRVKFV